MLAFASVNGQLRGHSGKIGLTCFPSAVVRLFGVVKSNVSYHLKNIFGTDELDYGATVQKIRTVREDRTRLPRPRIAQARQRALSAQAAALDPAEFGILYVIGSRGGFAAQDTGETTWHESVKSRQKAEFRTASATRIPFL